MSDRSKVVIELDPFVHLDTDGIHHGVFVGNEDYPSAECTVSWDDLIQDVFNMHTICGQEGDVLSADSVPEVLEYAEGMAAAAQRFLDRINASKVFDRNEWVKGGINQGTINQYIKEYAEWKK